MKGDGDMGRPAKSLQTISKNLTKGELEARKEAETQVFKDKSEPVFADFNTTKFEKKLFEKLVEINDNFTGADSTSLSILTRSLYRFQVLNNTLDSLDPTDDQCSGLEKRIHAYERSINQHMNMLCIPLNQRLRLTHDLAKIMIEEKKLEQMNNKEAQKINPAYKLLEEIEEMNKKW